MGERPISITMEIRVFYCTAEMKSYEVTTSISEMGICRIWFWFTGFGSQGEQVVCATHWLAVLEGMMKRRNRCYVPEIPGTYSPPHANRARTNERSICHRMKASALRSRRKIGPGAVRPWSTGGSRASTCVNPLHKDKGRSVRRLGFQYSVAFLGVV